METLKLVPGELLPQKVFEGERGSYYAWTSSTFPFLGVGKVGGGQLTLHPLGFALPHFADCNKIGYVVSGNGGIAGIEDPGSSEEKVVKLKKGDAIYVPNGVVSWWFNGGNDEFHVIFLGETSHFLNPGQFNYCFIAGALGVLKGFSAKTLRKAYGLNEEQANELTKSQKGVLIIKLEEGQTMPKPSNNGNTKDLCFSFEEGLPDINVEKGGSLSILSGDKYPLLKGVELCASLLKLEPNAMFGPTYYAKDSGVQFTYVVKGSGSVQVVGMNGEIALDTQLEAGQVFVVPKYCVVAISAAEDGIECFSIVTTFEPVLSQLTGKTSIWKALAPEVVEASLNINPEFSRLFIDKISKTSIIMQPQ